MRSPVRSVRARESLGDEGGGVLAQGLGLLRGLGRGDAHRGPGADRAPVGALALRQPDEEGLAELAVDRLRLRAHLHGLLGPALRFLAGERGALLEALHAREIRRQALVEARRLALAGGGGVAPRRLRDP